MHVQQRNMEIPIPAPKSMTSDSFASSQDLVSCSGLNSCLQRRTGGLIPLKGSAEIGGTV